MTIRGQRHATKRATILAATEDAGGRFTSGGASALDWSTPTTEGTDIPADVQPAGAILQQRAGLNYRAGRYLIHLWAPPVEIQPDRHRVQIDGDTYAIPAGNPVEVWEAFTILFGEKIDEANA